jgi:hypothetical protein
MFVACQNHQRLLIVGDFRFFICTESAEDPFLVQRDSHHGDLACKWLRAKLVLSLGEVLVGSAFTKELLVYRNL